MLCRFCVDTVRALESCPKDKAAIANQEVRDLLAIEKNFVRLVKRDCNDKEKE